ncbi:MAG: hypothetical protein A2W99_09510 [Bacteroidetes bacterium GWF2_33_16]|nr:MAG: hypothetical protein A2X00_06420 [Bacteroidetes bacterium GWE2_32_14]OFY07233.1 MAG: hypothetical protein A2W99_09510 [Bacteroidetes bacterium GWF2_33_16]
MKTKIFLIAFTVLLNLSSNAQIKWGLYGGGSMLEYQDLSSQLDIGDAGTISFNTDFSNTMSYNLGLFIEFGLFKNLLLETGIFSGNKGFELIQKVITEELGPIDVNGDPLWDYTKKAYYNYTYKMPYIGIPIIFNYYVVNKRFKFYISIGQKLGWCFNSETTNNLLSSSGSGHGDVPNSATVVEKELPNIDIIVGEDGAFKSFHYDLVCGGGIGLGSFYLVYNYDYGLLNNSQIDILEFKSRVHNISLKIDLSKN